MATDRRVFLTVDEALSALPAGDGDVHTFLNPSGSVLIGAGWQRASVEAAIRGALKLEIGGGACRSMGHGLVIWKGPSEVVFVEAREERLIEIEQAASAAGEG